MEPNVAGQFIPGLATAAFFREQPKNENEEQIYVENEDQVANGNEEQDVEEIVKVEKVEVPDTEDNDEDGSDQQPLVRKRGRPIGSGSSKGKGDPKTKGTVELRDRTGYFVLGYSTDESGSFTPPPKKKITYYDDNRRCLKVATDLIIPNPGEYDDNDLDFEASMFRIFKLGIESMHPSAFFVRESPYKPLPVPGEYFESPYGIWLAKFVRFGNKDAQTLIHRGNKKDVDYFHNVCLMPVNIIPFIEEVLDETVKPIIVFIATRGLKHGTGHCSILALVPSTSGIKAYVKDSLPLADGARMPGVALPLLKAFGIATAEVHGEYNSKKYVSFTTRLKENYQVIGNILDGAYFWDKYYKQKFVKNYDVERKRFLRVQKS